VFGAFVSQSQHFVAAPDTTSFWPVSAYFQNCHWRIKINNYSIFFFIPFLILLPNLRKLMSHSKIIQIEYNFLHYSHENV
jgi:hypothetical protein